MSDPSPPAPSSDQQLHVTLTGIVAAPLADFILPAEVSYHLHAQARAAGVRIAEWLSFLIGYLVTWVPWEKLPSPPGETMKTAKTEALLFSPGAYVEVLPDGRRMLRNVRTTKTAVSLTFFPGHDVARWLAAKDQAGRQQAALQLQEALAGVGRQVLVQHMARLARVWPPGMAAAHISELAWLYNLLPKEMAEYQEEDNVVVEAPEAPLVGDYRQWAEEQAAE